MLFSTVHIYDCFIVKSINMNISIWLVNIVAHYDEYILDYIKMNIYLGPYDFIVLIKLYGNEYLPYDQSI